MKVLFSINSWIKTALATFVCFAMMTGTSAGQILLSHYKFDNDLSNTSNFVDTNGTPAPGGTYRTGTDSVTAVAGTPTFTTGVDGTPNGAILLDGGFADGGADGWVDITTAGHPGAPVGLVGTPTADDPFASSGNGLVSGTALLFIHKYLVSVRTLSMR